MTFVVLSPNRAYTGVTCGVRFDAGRGETDDALAAALLRRRGYEVIVPATPPVVAEPVVPSPPPAASANKAAWVDYAVAVGGDRATVEAMTKAAIIKQVESGRLGEPSVDGGESGPGIGADQQPGDQGSEDDEVGSGERPDGADGGPGPDAHDDLGHGG